MDEGGGESKGASDRKWDEEKREDDLFDDVGSVLTGSIRLDRTVETDLFR